MFVLWIGILAISGLNPSFYDLVLSMYDNTANLFRIGLLTLFSFCFSLHKFTGS